MKQFRAGKKNIFAVPPRCCFSLRAMTKQCPNRASTTGMAHSWHGDDLVEREVPSCALHAKHGFWLWHEIGAIHNIKHNPEGRKGNWARKLTANGL